MEVAHSKDFIHNIYTRFNVPTKHWEKTKKGNKVLTDEWMDERLALFSKYTLPSFKHQSEKNFNWYVFFDEKTKPKYWKEIEQLQTENNFFHPVKVTDNEQVQPFVIENANKLPENVRFIISTDVDNDDAVSVDFVKNIQQNFKPRHNLVIDFPDGYRLLELGGKKIMLQEFQRGFNAFVSIVESRNQFESIFKERHKNYKFYPNVIKRSGIPMYIQVVHNSNQLNKFIDNWALPQFDFKEFGLNPQNFKIDKIGTHLFNSKLMMKKAKEKSKRLFRK